MTFNDYLTSMYPHSPRILRYGVKGSCGSNASTINKNLDKPLLAYGIIEGKGILGIFRGKRSIQAWAVSIPNDFRKLLGLHVGNYQVTPTGEKLDATDALDALLNKQDMFAKIVLTEDKQEKIEELIGKYAIDVIAKCTINDKPERSYGEKRGYDYEYILGKKQSHNVTQVFKLNTPYGKTTAVPQRVETKLGNRLLMCFLTDEPVSYRRSKWDKGSYTFKETNLRGKELADLKETLRLELTVTEL